MNRRRDMDLIRSLMLEIEEGRADFEPIDGEAFVMMSDLEREQARESQDALFYHLDLLCRGQFIEGHFQMDGTLVVERITWAGHDFLDGVRDPDIWERTKAGAAKVGGFTADTLLALAKGYIKQKTLQHTGIEVDL